MKAHERHYKNFIVEIQKRGGDVSIDEKRYTNPLQMIDHGRSEGKKVWLLRCEAWRYYSSRFGSRRAKLAYLCGYDDRGTWAVRVPGTCKTVKEALDKLVPREIKVARKKGKRVLRQGDVYAVETTDRYDGAGISSPYFAADLIGWYVELAPEHTWHPNGRFLLHPEHTPMQVPFPCRFVVQKALDMNRGSGRGAGENK